MICPHCLKEVHLSEYVPQKGVPGANLMVIPEYRMGNSYYHLFRGAVCPACYMPIVVHDFAGLAANVEGIRNQTVNYFEEIVYPTRPALTPLPPEVPPEYREDFNEARLVRDLSPKSSAALGRRLLQRVLHSHFNIKKPNLQQEIQDFISTVQPPTNLIEQLDAIRVIGNFAAHPLKDTATGEIQDVEPGEAEWLIETMESMLDFAFVQPAKSAGRKAAINAKLVAAGKPPIP